MDQTTVVSVAQLNDFGSFVKTTSDNIANGAREMTAELQRTLAEWGEGTESRAAYNEFKRRVDQCLEEMNAALAKMPGAISEAANAAATAEHNNKKLFAV